ncbi:MAG: hypothetical protein H0W02_06735 [Ktedonobacteraceae bacterium]|nr:hypothetical protein [Ktedonobacteraceae bacterium]
MPRIPSGDTSSGSGAIFYPLDRMREAAAKILVNAGEAQQSHNAAWAKVQSYVQSFPGFMQGPIMTVLSRYDARLRASYQWQLDFANTLFDAADAMDTTDNNIADSFNPGGFGHNRAF